MRGATRALRVVSLLRVAPSRPSIPSDLLMVHRVAFGGLLLALVVGGGASFLPIDDSPARSGRSPSASLRLNDLQVLGSHNSYKAAIDTSLMQILRQRRPETARALDHAYPPLREQLEYGLRSLELDVFHDPKGGRYAPHGLQLVEAGYMVRTRADANTIEARTGETRRREAAFASGAHVVSTDYYRPDSTMGTGYQVSLPGGEPGRCNPLTAPDWCDRRTLVDP